MAELIAQGQEDSQIQQLILADGQVVRFGRAPKPDEGMKLWFLPWDQMISRDYAVMVYQHGRLMIQRLPGARNPIYKDEVEQESECCILPGESFRIGATKFQFEAPELLFQSDPDEPEDGEEEGTSIAERVYSSEDLRGTEFGNQTERMEVFSKIPSLMTTAKNDAEFASNLVNELLPTIPLGQAAAVIRCRNLADADELTFDLVRKVLRDPEKVFHPSRRLVRAALEEGTSRVHMWNQSQGPVAVTENMPDDASNSANFEWAISVPVPVPQPHAREWCLYVTGKFALGDRIILDLDDLKPEVRYIELLAQFVGATQQARLLQQQQASLGRFFSPNVVSWLNESHDPEVLAPRQCNITALVCDLRGFSRQAEDATSGHRLHQLLMHVSEALGVMTRSIFQQDGVVGGYQGDSALGFWGWPVDNSEGPIAACRAALQIQQEFRKAQTQGVGPLADLQMGIGIANGGALVGKIGTKQHAIVGAFGPVIETSSRLESLTKKLRASILMDEYTSEFVRKHLSPSEGRSRRLGRVWLPGVAEPVMVSELLPPVQDDPVLSDEHLKEYEFALKALMEGRWEDCLKSLDRMPPEDRAKDFLMIFIAKHNYQPPPNWDGVLT